MKWIEHKAHSLSSDINNAIEEEYRILQQLTCGSIDTWAAIRDSCRLGRKNTANPNPSRAKGLTGTKEPHRIATRPVAPATLLGELDTVREPSSSLLDNSSGSHEAFKSEEDSNTKRNRIRLALRRQQDKIRAMLGRMQKRDGIS